MKLYGGIDLHSNNNVIGLSDEAVDALLPDRDLALAVKANVSVLTCLRQQKMRQQVPGLGFCGGSELLHTAQ